MIYYNNMAIDEVQLCKVEGSSCNLAELTATENKVYTPTEGADGYSKVTVNVPSLGDNLDWSAIGYSENPANYEKIVEDGYNYAKQIYDTWDASQTELRDKFRGDNNLVFMPAVDTSLVTNMQYMFGRCGKLKSVTTLDTSKVTNMNSMFSDCLSLTSIPKLDTSNVTNMFGMFQGCSALTTIPQLDTSKVTEMRNIFARCSSLTSIPPIDLSSAKNNVNTMFVRCSSLQSITLTGDPSKITNMDGMFGVDEPSRLKDNGTLIYDHRYDYTAIINELHKYNPTWTAKPDNQ